MENLKEIVKQYVAEAAESSLKDEEKKAQVTEKVTAWLNDKIDVPILTEEMEGKLLGYVVSALIELAYELLTKGLEEA